MMLEFDTDAGATYLRVSDSPVARTRSLSDVVMVDLDARGGVVGLELLVAPRQALDDRIYKVLGDEYPELWNMLVAAIHAPAD